MNKIVASILEEFSKANGIEKLEEKDRFEYLTAYLTIRAERLILRTWLSATGVTQE
jgi:hypothetical protein